MVDMLFLYRNVPTNWYPFIYNIACGFAKNKLNWATAKSHRTVDNSVSSGLKLE